MNETSSGPDAAETPRDADPDESESRSQNWGLFGRVIGVISGTQPYSVTTDTSKASTDPARPGLLNLRRMRVDDVSIPKAEIVAVPIGTTQNELVKVFRESGLTRIPVFEGTLDTPVGIVNLKDFALRFGFNGKHDDFDLRNILRPLLYVPPSMPLGVLLQKMQAERIHMALVIDEYGGTDGLVTIEDLIEQVVGEIEDEHDVDEATSFIEERPGCWLALAKTPLDEFEPAIGMSLTSHEEIDDEEVETLGGLAFMLAGHVPARGEVIRHPDGPEFEVIDADARRIKRLRVRLNPVREMPQKAAE
jgi:magnesium and cobalt transporter